jgi:RNA polymerase sigma-70 factor (ECF subfamily)
MTERSETSSEQLMQAVAAGDLGAFEMIVLRHQAQAWGIAYRFLGNPHTAEDIAQESFLLILDAVPAYRPTAAFRTYLVRVVTRFCLDYVEKKRPVLADEPPDMARTSESGLASRRGRVCRKFSPSSAQQDSIKRPSR